MTDQNGDEKRNSPSGKVGYRKPPTASQFKTSGHRNGRPKGSKNRKTVVTQVANETHAVVEGDVRRRRSTVELVVLTLRNAALEGKNTQAIDEIHRLLKKYEPQSTGNVGWLVVPAEISPEEWVAREEEANKTRKPPPGLAEVYAKRQRTD